MFKFIILALAIAFVLIARKAKPASEKAGAGLVGSVEPTYQPELLTVATYNIQTGKSNEGKRNLIASANVIEQADLVGIQEVYGVGFDGLFNKGQTERLADYGKFSYLFSATRRRWFREHRGNAILSRLVISNWKVINLPDTSGKSFRNMTIAEVNWQGKTFHFINTHLHTRGGREDQLEIVLQEFAKYPRAIIVGDFNSHQDSKALSNALKNIEITDAVAVAGLHHSDRIDWILSKGFNVESGEIQEKGVSDHPYYQVSLRYANE